MAVYNKRRMDNHPSTAAGIRRPYHFSNQHSAKQTRKLAVIPDATATR
jgi:hypothetical protein